MQALVLNNEIAALRARVPLEHDVERGHNAGPGAAGRAHQKRGNVCAVEARALERLLKRDRVGRQMCAQTKTFRNTQLRTVFVEESMRPILPRRRDVDRVSMVMTLLESHP